MKKINFSDIIGKQEMYNIIQKYVDKNSCDIVIEYPSVFTSSKVLRDFIVAISDFYAFSAMWKSRLTLIMDELNNNAIEHGSLEGDLNYLKIKIDILQDNKANFCLEIEDSGKGKNHKTAKEMILLRNRKKLKGFYKNEGIRGRGLFMIIEKLVDELYFKDSERGGLIVGIKKEIILENTKK